MATAISEQVTLSLHIYKLCQLNGLPSGNSSHVPPDNPVDQLNLSSLVNLLNSLLKFCYLPAIREQIFPPGETLGCPSNSNGCFERVFTVFKDWPHEFCRLVEKYEASLRYETHSWHVNRQVVQGMLDFFQAAFICFAQDYCSFIRELLEDYFGNFLKTNSVKKLKIYFYKNYQYRLVCIFIRKNTSLTERLAKSLELEGVTLAKIFAVSRIGIYNETIFFRMPYFPDLSALSI